MKKIGFCCKYKANPSLSLKEQKEIESVFNTGSLTLFNFYKLNKKDQALKLEEITLKNLEKTLALINYVKKLPDNLRLLRISSDILPLYTSDKTKEFYNSEIKKHIEKQMNIIGQIAKDNNIRIGFHPDQFCILNSEGKVFDNALREFEYHIYMAELMGFFKWHENGFFCNIHTGNKNFGIDGLIKNLSKISRTGRNLITIENDEFSFGLNDIVKLKKQVALVFDIHHHWINTGSYLSVNDPIINELIESWRGEVPLMHYSISREDILINHNIKKLPDYKSLIKQGFNRTQLRKHSDYYWNDALNEIILDYIKIFDIEFECKMKNLATELYYKKYIKDKLS